MLENHKDLTSKKQITKEVTNTKCSRKGRGICPQICSFRVASVKTSEMVVDGQTDSNVHLERGKAENVNAG